MFKQETLVGLGAFVVGLFVTTFLVMWGVAALAQPLAPLTVLVVDQTQDLTASLAINSVFANLKPLLPTGTRLEGLFMAAAYDLELPYINQIKLRFGRYDLIVVVPKRVVALQQIWVAGCYPRYPIDPLLLGAVAALRGVITDSDLPGVSLLKVLTAMDDFWVGLLAEQFRGHGLLNC